MTLLRDINQIKNRQFDLIICGGGIYGAWTAYDAALRGLSVALIDKGDWASGTSSASSKLIHGGLRYLETFDFQLVKKSLAERQMLLKAAPHRVWPLRFGIPTYKQNRLNPLKLKIGLFLYDWLGGDLPDSQKHQQHSQNDLLALFPHINTNGLTGGFSYSDAQTDDARFVLEIIDGASTAGAACVNYSEAIRLTEKDNGVQSVTVFDHVSNETIQTSAKQVVDTTGRWSAQFQHQQKHFRLAKGIHLLLPNIKNDNALLLTAKKDGRVFFIIPWYGLTLVGTTDTDYDADLDNVEITKQDINYLLTEVNLALPSVHWTEPDIIGKYAGLRVLQESSDINPSSVSRDWALMKSANGLLTSIGGKFTSAREDAAIIVDAVCNNLNLNTPSKTFGKPFPWLSKAKYSELLSTTLANAKQLEIDENSAIWLTKRHGEKSTEIISLCQENKDFCKRITPELPFIMADLIYCAANEMVVHLDDLLRRRLPLLILAKLTDKTLTQVGRIVGNRLGWDEEKIMKEINLCKKLNQ